MQPEDDGIHKASLPRLHPLIRLYRGPALKDGSPSWTLYHPVAHKYYQIGWPEFECLSRLAQCKNPAELLQRVNKETPLQVDEEDLKNLLLFLQQKDLLDNNLIKANPPEKDGSIWMNIFHKYLFFHFPLFAPEKFLEKTYPYLSLLFTARFLKVTAVLFLLLFFLTLQRIDEFLYTFANLFSVQGAILFGGTLLLIKVLHEFGHAYTAHKYGVRVPHMGVAFMVLYPVLYTETTEAWKIKDRKARIHIGLAGVCTELVLATYALALWYIFPPGPVQSLAFAIVTISLIGSLFVNLNPLMRFDGYFVLSDSLGIENLHGRGFSFAKWWLRKTLFSLEDPPPEPMPESRTRFLIAFGWATIVYRFFLFLGIALLVYWMFFKPLGFILMVAELWWFIALPVWREIKVWWVRRHEILRQRRARILGIVLSVFILLFILPVHSAHSVPAVAYSEHFRAFHAPVISSITEIHIANGQNVEAGETLMVLQSPSLEYEIKKNQALLKKLKAQKRADFISEFSEESRKKVFDEEIAAQERTLETLKKRQEDLFITAPFAGQVVNFDDALAAGLTVSPANRLFDLVRPGEIVVTGFAREENIQMLERGQKARFISNQTLFGSLQGELNNIEDINSTELSWPELASVYGGPVPAERKTRTSDSERLEPLYSIYAIHFKQEIQGKSPPYPVITTGRLVVDARMRSPLLSFSRRVVATVLREAGLN